MTTPISGSFPQELKDDHAKEHSPTPITAWPVADSGEEKDDYFDSFADLPPDTASATPGEPSSTGFNSSWDWDTVDTPPEPLAALPARPGVPGGPGPIIPPRRSSKGIRSAPSKEALGLLPPTNIPPPSILLSIFPDLLDEADIKLYKPTTATSTQSVKARIYADPATQDYLRGYLALATVAARILAGRKLRWHRDKFLSQAMTISAAAGGKGTGGMKLAGIDKTQAAREDREAADVVGVWRDHVGKLRSAVAAANNSTGNKQLASQPLLGPVPEINDHMVVSTAKSGALTAPRACVVCGLKRDERLKGVDPPVVEDSFGEWWVEHWGHRACRNFWLGHEAMLRSR